MKYFSVGTYKSSENAKLNLGNDLSEQSNHIIHTHTPTEAR